MSKTDLKCKIALGTISLKYKKYECVSERCLSEQFFQPCHVENRLHFNETFHDDAVRFVPDQHA
jgi:hypothetical protein